MILPTLHSAPSVLTVCFSVLLVLSLVAAEEFGLRHDKSRKAR
ncbi:MAG: hypothetical protein ACRYGP_11220 [Janthinobacterium lividum]